MTVHSLGLHKLKKHRPDARELYRDDTWLVFVFNVGTVEHYRLQFRNGLVRTESVMTYDTETANTNTVGFTIVENPTGVAVDRKVEEMRHLQKLLAVMQGIEDRTNALS